MSGLWRYILGRVLAGVLVVFAVAGVTFFLIRAVPGGPFTAEKELSPEVQENLNRKYGLDDPIVVQLGRVLAGVPTLDFGKSMKFRDRDVRDMIAEFAPVSLILGIEAFILALLLGLSLGFASGYLRFTSPRGGDFADRLVQVAATAGIAVPSFVVGGILIYLFAFELPIFPPARWEGPLHTVLPALTLAAAPAAYIARIARSALIDTMGEPYVQTARAKGISTVRVVFAHAVPGALYTVLTVLGPIFATLVTGSFVVEMIFSIPGMGRFFVLSVTDRDYTMILGITVLYTVAIVAANLLVDLAYGVLDPRVRLHGEEAA